MMPAEPALFDADFNPSCAVSEMKCLSVTVRKGVPVMLHGCRDGYNSTSLQLEGIRCFLQGYFSNADTCHNRDFSSWRDVCLQLQYTWRTLSNLWKFKLLLSCCQTMVQANVSVLAVIWGLYFVSLTPHNRWGRGGACRWQLWVWNMRRQSWL